MNHILTFFLAISATTCISFSASSKISADTNDVVTLDVLEQPEIPPVLDTLVLPIPHNDEGIDILLPGMYRGDEPSDYAHMLIEDWCELYRDTLTNNYYLRKAVIEIGKFDDMCIDDSTTYVVANRATESEYLLKDYSVLLIKGLEPQNKVLDVPVIKQGMVWADSTMTFVFDNKKYSLSATGSVQHFDTQEYLDQRGLRMRWENVINYKLYLTADTGGRETTQLLVAVPSSSIDMNVTILFIGDLDGDGKPDFVFNTGRDYEETRAVLFLSSKAGEGEIVRCVGESFYQFDC